MMGVLLWHNWIGSTSVVPGHRFHPQSGKWVKKDPALLHLQHRLQLRQLGPYPIPGPGTPCAKGQPKKKRKKSKGTLETVSSKYSKRKEDAERLSDFFNVTIKFVAKWGLKPTSPGTHSRVVRSLSAAPRRGWMLSFHFSCSPSPFLERQSRVFIRAGAVTQPRSESQLPTS